MSTCSKNPLGDIFNNIGNPIEIPSGTSITDAELDSKLSKAYSNLEKNPRKTVSQQFDASVKAGEINALSIMSEEAGKKEKTNDHTSKKRKWGGKKQRGGETEEERKANENKALVVATVLTFIICDQTFGPGVSKPLTLYLKREIPSITENALTLVNQVFQGVIESYAKALPGVRGGCEGALDYTIDIARDIPFIGNFVSLGSRLPTCAQRMLSYNETITSIKKILGELLIVAGTTAASIGVLGNYKNIWNDDAAYPTSAQKVVAVCSAIGGDTMSLGSTTINALLYIPLASTRALSRIVPNATATVWTAATGPRQWLESWGSIENSAQRIAITASADTSDGTTSGTTSDGAASASTSNEGDERKRQRTDEPKTSSGGRRTRRRKSHNKAAKKSRKQKKKRSSTKHKRRGRKTRRGGMGCGNHKKTKRRRR